MNATMQRERFNSTQNRVAIIKKNMRAKELSGKIQMNHVYALASVISIIFLLFGLLFVTSAAKLSRAETIGYIQAATNQTQSAIEEHIREEFDTLDTAAGIIKGSTLLGDDDHIDVLAKTLRNHNDYVLVGHADVDGQAVWVDYYGREHLENISAEDFFTEALAGGKSLSGARYDNISKMTVHYYAVPIFDEDIHAIIGVLFAADPQDEIRKVVDRSLYAGEGLAHIIDARGDYVVQSSSPISIGTGSNIFEISSPLSASAQQRILDDFANRQPGYLEKALPGERRLVAYTPLNINDWYVFYAVPEHLVNAELKTITMGSAIVVSVATGVFILLILLIRYVNKENRRTLEQMAYVDPITGQRSYQKFLLDAEEIIENTDGAHYAICYSDIKGFRYLRDIFGRETCDQLLRYLAEFLQRVSQKGEISCRLGEDTFVSLRIWKSKQDIELRFDSAAQFVAVFPEIMSRGYKPELYGGAYIIDPADGPLTLNDMLDRAIAAQEEAKFTGGTEHFCLYSHEMREQKLWETETESKMEAALENGEFKVFLQPKIDIQHKNSVQGAEALVRWETEQGLIPPGRFISLFEKNGFILRLDRYIFESVCSYYKENLLKDSLPPYILSVNVSRLVLMQPDFAHAYAAIKNRYGIPDERIELEFTESFAFDNHELFQKVVADCKRNGFICSIDDFGSGYSSLHMLKSIPVDILKLDRKFFLRGGDRERGQALVRNIIAMAKDMDMKTIAEGIEEEAQVDQLQAMKCDAIQGFVFAKPMPMEDFTGFLASWQGA